PARQPHDRDGYDTRGHYASEVSTMTDLAKNLRDAIDMDAATATDAEWSNLLATAMDVLGAIEREPINDGLKQPVRPFSETYSGYDLLKRTFGKSTEPDEAMVERVARAVADAIEGRSFYADSDP